MKHLLVSVAAFFMTSTVFATDVNPFSMFAGQYKVLKASCYKDGDVVTATLTCTQTDDASCKIEFFAADGHEWRGLSRTMRNRDESEAGNSITEEVKKIPNGALVESTRITHHGYLKASIQMTKSSTSGQVDYIEKNSDDENCQMLLQEKR